MTDSDLMQRAAAARLYIDRVYHPKGQAEDLELMAGLVLFGGMDAEKAAIVVRENRRKKELEREGKHKIPKRAKKKAKR